MISVERLSKEAEATGFRPDVQEKVILLIELLNAFAGDEFLSTRLALKGGTALNLFQFNLPRLSVDIDLNYVGHSDLEAMKAERPTVEGLYGAMNPLDLRQVKIDDIKVSGQELKEKFVPVLRLKTVKELGSLDEYGKQIVQRCKNRMSTLLPLTAKEAEFIRLLGEDGKIDPALLTSDSNLQAIISEHPALRWRVFQERSRK